jgi:hypothetical protein
MSKLPDAVLRALARDEVPIPIRAGNEKKPAVKWAHLQQLPRPTRRDIERFPSSDLWGVLTGAISGLVVLDFDGDEGRELAEQYGFPIHLTTKKGSHLRVEHPGVWVKTRRAVLPGLDVRGDGGYELFYGPDREEQRDLGDLLPWSELPKELRARIINLSKRLPVDLLVDLAARQGQNGGRNDTGFDLARWMRDNKYSPQEALDAGAQYVDLVGSNGDHPYTLEEFKASIEQAYNGGEESERTSYFVPTADGRGSRFSAPAFGKGLHAETPFAKEPGPKGAIWVYLDGHYDPTGEEYISLKCGVSARFGGERAAAMIG